MSTDRSGLRAAAFLFCLAASAATGALAQQAQPAQPDKETVGPPALKDFSLPGQRTTPPVQQPQPAETQPPARAEPAPAATRSPQPRRETAPTTPAERPAPRQPAPSEAPRTAAPAPSAAPEVSPAPVEPVATTPALGLPTEPSPAPVPAPAPAAAPEEGTDWVFPAMALAFAGLAVFAFLALSRRRRTAPAARAAAPVAPPRQVPPPGAKSSAPPVRTPKPAPAPAPAADTSPRPWIELSIKADRAAATDKEAVIHYELLLDNAGDAPAGNIRIAAKMFNATAEKEIAAFFNGPMHEKSGSPHIVIAPEKGLRLGGQVSMPLEDVRQIELQGRRLFIPIVAINVAYDWGDSGTGRTSKSWIVGTQPQQEAEKMGAFRLDLGPRIYRSVGQRVAQLVKV